MDIDTPDMPKKSPQEYPKQVLQWNLDKTERCIKELRHHNAQFRESIQAREEDIAKLERRVEELRDMNKDLGESIQVREQEIVYLSAVRAETKAALDKLS